MKNIKTSMDEALQNAAFAYRLGMEGKASNELVLFIDLLIPNLQNSDKLKKKGINILLEAILSAQSRRDYLYMADLLEYELLPCLKEA